MRGWVAVSFWERLNCTISIWQSCGSAAHNNESSPPNTKTTFLELTPVLYMSSSLVKSNSHGFLLDCKRLAAVAAVAEELDCSVGIKPGGRTMCWIFDGRELGRCGSVGKRSAGRKESLGGRLDIWGGGGSGSSWEGQGQLVMKRSVGRRRCLCRWRRMHSRRGEGEERERFGWRLTEWVAGVGRLLPN